MNAEHGTDKTHPIAGYLAAVIMAGLLVVLMGSFNGMNKALLVVPVFLGWAIVSLVLFGRLATGDHGDGSGH